MTDHKYPKWITDQLYIIAKEEGVSMKTIITRMVKERVLQELQERNQRCI